MPSRSHARGNIRHNPALHRPPQSEEIAVTGLGGLSYVVSPSRHYPLGATLDAHGVTFAVYAKHAHAVFVALFDQAQGEPLVVIPLPERTHGIWHGHVRGLEAGQLYAFQVDGPWDPKHGHRYNPYKYLIDPYALSLSGGFSTEEHLHLAYDPDHPDLDLAPDRRSNARVIPKCVVTGRRHFDWQGITSPGHSMEDLVIYEAHVKGFTAHPSSGVKNPGTYLGFMEKIPYLKSLGVNAVELLPIQAKYSEDHLTQKGLVNYWGYNTVAFFCLEPSYAAGDSPWSALHEFKTLVRELHRAGIEVILDVVYNHTAEGNELGPTLSFRGLDNTAYYSLIGEKHEMRQYRNVTGCGNTLDFGSPIVVRLAMDSLRYLVEECHVDGFRFDLATVLGRQGKGDYGVKAPLFQAISQDPVLHRVKLISEPWDLQAYGLGAFPAEWAEWNGKFRDTLRRFIKGDDGQLPDLGWRLTGSADLFGEEGRGPDASINFITCHDGFTLWDLVSYNRKRNEANREENRDGSDHNESWNCGVEGPTHDSAVLQLRQKQARNFMTLLLLSHGIPMLNAGDEMLRSQGGNNNPYCQDNELAWIDWGHPQNDKAMMGFVAQLIALRKSLPVRRGGKEGGNAEEGLPQSPPAEVKWLGANGNSPAWTDARAKHLAYILDPAEKGLGRPVPGKVKARRIGILVNAENKGLTFALPENVPGHRWYWVVQTAASTESACLPLDKALPLEEGFGLPVPDHSITVVIEKPWP